MRKPGKSEPLDALLRRVLHDHPAFSANPLGNWEDLVGVQIARYSQPQSLKNKVLVIVAYDSIWKHHLELNKEGLIHKINDGRPESLVEKIVIRVGELSESMPVLNPNHRLLEKMKAKRPQSKKQKRPPARPLTEEEKTLLKELPDAELRKVGRRLLSRFPAAPAQDDQD